MYLKFVVNCQLLCILCFIFLLPLPGQAMEPILMRAGKYEFKASDFEYHYLKAHSGNIDECLSHYIPYRLKTIAGTESGLDTLPSFISEYTKYRNLLADKYLTDTTTHNQMLHEAYNRSHYEIKTAHILLRLSGPDTLPVYQKIMSIREQAISGEDFGKLAVNYSEDTPAKYTHGDLGYITVFRMPYPFETVAYNTAVGQVSMPVRTSFGYHIIKVSERRQVEVARTYEEVRPKLQQKMKYNDRTALCLALFITKLKTKYNFTENTALLENRYNNKILESPLFSFAGKDYRLSDFEQYLKINHKHSSPLMEAYLDYVNLTLLDYENHHLEQTDKKFKETISQYYEGLLLFDIFQREIWTKATQDSAALIRYYQKHARSYRWKKRIDATIYHCSSKDVAIRMSRTVHNKNAGMGRLPDSMFTFFCDPDGTRPCIDTIRRVLPKGAGTIADKVKWEKGCSEVLEWNGKFVFLDIHEILYRSRKTFEEARGSVMADYQNHLEDQWIERLKKEYPVTVDQIVWADLKKKYADNKK